MRARFTLLVGALALCGSAAGAQGFLPLGGYTGTSHYAVETLASGYTSTADAVLSHGSLPAVSTYTSGVESVAVASSDIRVTLSSDGMQATVSGAPEGCRYRLFSISGLTLADGALAGGVIDMRAYPAGHYLLQLLPQSQTPCTKHLLKRQ